MVGRTLYSGMGLYNGAGVGVATPTARNMVQTRGNKRDTILKEGIGLDFLARRAK